MNEIMDFENSQKLINKGNIENLKRLQKLIEINFELDEKTEIIKPLCIIIFCLKFPMYF